MSIWFKCPHCGKGSVDEQGETLLDYEAGLYECENCGGAMSSDNDSITYEEYVKLWQEELNRLDEDYVDFKTAKLLSEKGFNVPCMKEISRGVIPDILIITTSEKNKYPCPTLQMTMKWLREVHNLHCDIGYDDLDWFWNILDISKSVPVEERPRMIKDGSAGFKSYEEAAKAAIKYCLENLI